jgi:hypothetical protein
VRSWLKRHEAERVAWSEPGVTKTGSSPPIPIFAEAAQANLACDLDGAQRSRRFSPLSNRASTTNIAARPLSLASQLTSIDLTIIMVFSGRSEIDCSNGIFGIAPWNRWLNCLT